MFRKYIQFCGSSAVHARHTVLCGLFDREVCPGISETKPLTVTDPSIRQRIINDFYRDRSSTPTHKHYYKLVPYYRLFMPSGVTVSDKNVYWQCFVCWKVYFTNRQSLHEEILRKSIEQSWPS